MQCTGTTHTGPYQRRGVTIADIPADMLASWREQRALPDPPSYKALSRAATEQLGIPVRDDFISRALHSIAPELRGTTAVSKGAGKEPAPQTIRSEPKPAGHPDAWEALMRLTPSLLRPDGSVPEYKELPPIIGGGVKRGPPR